MLHRSTADLPAPALRKRCGSTGPAGVQHCSPPVPGPPELPHWWTCRPGTLARAARVSEPGVGLSHAVGLPIGSCRRRTAACWQTLHRRSVLGPASLPRQPHLAWQTDDNQALHLAYHYMQQAGNSSMACCPDYITVDYRCATSCAEAGRPHEAFAARPCRRHLAELLAGAHQGRMASKMITINTPTV